MRCRTWATQSSASRLGVVPTVWVMPNSAGSFALGTTNERVSALEMVSELNGARAQPLAA